MPLNFIPFTQLTEVSKGIFTRTLKFAVTCTLVSIFANLLETQTFSKLFAKLTVIWLGWKSGNWTLSFVKGNKYCFKKNLFQEYCSEDLDAFEKLSPRSISNWKVMGKADPKITHGTIKLKCAPSQYYCPMTAAAAGENAQGQCVHSCDMPASEDDSSKCIGFTDTTFEGDSRVCAIQHKCPPCHNGGVSLGHAKGCKCACDIGFQGQTCEELVPCTNMCQNGGYRLGSVRKTNDCKCLCRQGYAGTQCEIKLTCPNKCREGNPRTNSCACGTLCKNKCVNGAWSQNPDDTPVCMCSCMVGWKGLDCSRKVPCTNICYNGGIRKGTVASENCGCDCRRTGFSGTACTKPISLWTALEKHPDLTQFVQILQHPDHAFYKDLLNDLSANPAYNNITVFAPLDRFSNSGVDPSLHITPSGDHVQSFFESGHQYPTLKNYVKVSITGNQVTLNGKVEIENLKGYISAANGIIHPIKGYLGANPCQFQSDTSEECLSCSSDSSACHRAACWYGFDRDQNRCNSKPWCTTAVCENLRHTEKNELYPPLSVKDDTTVGDVMTRIQQQTGVSLSKENVIINGLPVTDLADQKPIADVRDIVCETSESNCNLISVTLKLSRGNSPSECCENEVTELSHLPLCSQARWNNLCYLDVVVLFTLFSLPKLYLQDICAAPDLVQRAEEGLRGASTDVCCLCRATVNCGPSGIRLKRPVNGKCCRCGPNFPCTGDGFKLKPFAFGRTREECCTKDCIEVGNTKVCEQPDLCPSDICTKGGFNVRPKIKLHFVNEPATVVDPFGASPSTCCSCALDVKYCDWHGFERLEIPVEVDGKYTCCLCGNVLCPNGVRAPRTMAAHTKSDCCQEQPDRRKLDAKIATPSLIKETTDTKIRRRRLAPGWITETDCFTVFKITEVSYTETCPENRVRDPANTACYTTWPRNCTHEKETLNNPDLASKPCCLNEAKHHETCCAGH